MRPIMNLQGEAGKIDSAIIIKSFKMCSISNALDGTEDNTLYEDSSEGDTDSDPFADLDEEIPYDDIE